MSTWHTAKGPIRPTTRYNEGHKHPSHRHVMMLAVNPSAIATRNAAPFLGILAAALLAGCGGHAVAVPSAPATPAAVFPQAKATLAITIPAKGSVAANQRRTLYVSPSTTQLTIVASIGAAILTTNATIPGANCTATAGTEACAIPVDAPIGATVVFDVTAKDGSANVLSHGTSAPAPVIEGGTNLVPALTLNPVPHTVAMTFNAVPFGAGASTTAGTFTATDVDANVIGSGANFTQNIAPWTTVSFQIAATNNTSIPGITFSSGACPGVSVLTVSAPLSALTLCGAADSTVALGTTLTVTSNWGGVANTTVPIHFGNIAPGAQTSFAMTNAASLGHIVATTELQNLNTYYGVSDNGSAMFLFAGVFSSTVAGGCGLPERLMNSESLTPQHPYITVLGGGTVIYVGGVDLGGSPRLVEFSGGGCTEHELTGVSEPALPVAGIASDASTHTVFGTNDGTTNGGLFYVPYDFGASNPVPVRLTGNSGPGSPFPNSVVFSPDDNAFYAGESSSTAGEIDRVDNATLAVTTMNLPSWSAGKDVQLIVSPYDGTVYAYGVKGTTTHPPQLYYVAGGASGFHPSLLYSWPSGGRTSDPGTTEPGALIATAGPDGSVYMITYNSSGTSPQLDRVDTATETLFPNQATVTPTTVAGVMAFGTGRLQILDGSAADS
jgi:hypothetical protein